MNELVEKKKSWELLYDAVANLTYGDVLTHNEIMEIIHIDYKNERYNTTISRARKELLKIGKELESIHGQGYRVLNPDNYVDKSLDKYKEGFKKLKKGGELLDYAPTQDMSTEGLKRYNTVADRSKAVLAMLGGGFVELKMLATKKNHPLLNDLNKTK